MTTIAGIEREAIVLMIGVESINAMVNYEVFSFSSDRRALEARFASFSQRALFNVLMADLLEQVDPKLLGKNGSLLESLDDVSTTPRLGGKTRARRLSAAVRKLTRWLDKFIVVPVWFPSLDVNLRLRLRRRDFVTICGNISKHKPSRLTGKAHQLQELLRTHGVVVDLTDSLRSLDDFQERFHADILVYHAIYIAEMLNNIRWAIHEYLLPLYRRSYVSPITAEDPRYSFKSPLGMVNKYAKDCFWDLMNTVRAEPWIAPFTASRFLKGRY